MLDRDAVRDPGRARRIGGLRPVAYALILIVLVSALGIGSAVRAQNQGLVVRDGTIKPELPLLVGPGEDPLGQHADYLISSELGDRVGRNLFHSFDRFGIGPGEVATFTGPDAVLGPQSIQNIISRVTGTTSSQIDGTLRSTVPGAAVYLLNPRGISFGPDSSLDLQGSFHASTAEQLHFEEGDPFPILRGETAPVLSVAEPSAFGFIGGNQGVVSVEGGSLVLPAGQSLSLVGADVQVRGAESTNDTTTLGAESGTIQIFAVGGRSGEVAVTPDSRLTSGWFSALGNMDPGVATVSDGAHLTVSGTDEPLGATGTASGSIFIRGDQIVLERGSEIEALNHSEGVGGGIQLIGSSISLTGEARVTTGARNSGEGGSIDIQADDVLLRSGAIIESATTDRGNAGSIIVEASTMSLDSLGPPFFFQTRIVSTGRAGIHGGDAGDISIRAKTLNIEGDAVLGPGFFERSPSGNIEIISDSVSVTRGGTIRTNGRRSFFGDTLLRIVSPRLTIDSGRIELSGGGGDAGSAIVLQVGTLIARASEIIHRGDGKRDSININASESISLTENSSLSMRIGFLDETAIIINTPTLLLEDSFIQIDNLVGFNVGSASISINVDTLALTDGAEIFLDGQGQGASGNIEIIATDSVSVAGSITPTGFSRSVIRSDTDGPGNAGSIRIVSPALIIEDLGTISARTTIKPNELPFLPGGDGGQIDLRVDVLEVRNGGFITAQGDSDGQGGSVRIEASESVAVTGSGFGLRSSIDVRSFGEGDAGDIFIHAPLVVLESGGITASTTGSGAGGMITVETNVLTLAEGAMIRSRTTSENSDAGKSGDIVLNVGQLHLSGGSAISAGSRGGGLAGGIDVTAGGSVQLMGGSTISSQALESDGGNIRVTARDLIYLLDGSSITTRVGDDGTGGTITIDPEFVVINNGTIDADAGTGTGGSVDITGDFVFVSSDSRISASSETGVDGTVVIRAPDVDLSAQLNSLPESFMDASGLFAMKCGLRGRERSGSFTVEARPGLPRSPDAPRVPRYSTLEDTGSILAHAEPWMRAVAAERSGDSDAAIARWLEVVSVLEEGEKLRLQLEARLRLAGAYEAVGEGHRALKVLDDARERASELGNPELDAALSGLRTRVLASAGAVQVAVKGLGEAIEQLGADGTHRLLAMLELERGNLAAEAERFEAATEHYAKARKHAAQAKARALVAMAYSNHARPAIEVGELAEARSLLEKAAEALSALPSTHERLFTALHIARGYERLSGGMDAGGVADRLRAGELYADTAERAHALGDVRAAAYAWGYLGGLYEQEGRSAEALELTRRALAFAQEAEAPESLLFWQWQAGRLLADREEIDAAIGAYTSAAESLRELRSRAWLRTLRSAALPVDPVVRGLVDLLLYRASFTEDPEAKESLLLRARDALEGLKADEIQDYFQDECVAGQRRELPESIPGAVVVYPVLLPDRMELIVSGGEGLRRFSVGVGAEEVRAEVRRFRQLLEKRTTNEYREPAAKLYTWLVRPLESVLDAEKPEALVFVPEGALRTVPMAALYDDKTGKFLVEMYPLAIVPGLSLTDPRPIAKGRMNVLRVGLTEGVQGYPAIPHVATEIREIETLSEGVTLLDADFSTAALEEQLLSAPFGIVHVASHGEFGGSPETTFLLTYDGKLQMNKLAELVKATEFHEEPLELLTLSACETAAGDERAALGLAGVAVKAGARSTLATLWRIDDRASAELVSEFYRQIFEPGVSRAEALRHAQLRLLAQPIYRHPAYWSPFLLIGSWL